MATFASARTTLIARAALPVLLAAWPLGRTVLAQSDVALSAGDVFKKSSASVVTIVTSSTTGSGVVVDSAGSIVTNVHVINGEERATIRLANGDTYDNITVLDYDVRKDLVLLKIKGFHLPTADLGDSDEVSVGAAVYAIGSPKGLDQSLSQGIVSGLREKGEGYRVLQTTAALSPGSSGGGLFDDRGRLIGITTYKVDGGENLNFALPINYVRGMLGASTTTMSLKDFAASSKPSEAPQGTTSQQPKPQNAVPALATLYSSMPGNVMLAEQSGETVHLTYMTPDGQVYGKGQLTWNVGMRGFFGHGTINTPCGSKDTRVWSAPLTQEIYVMSTGIIRVRSQNPAKVNCGKLRVTEVAVDERVWYVAPSK